MLSELGEVNILISPIDFEFSADVDDTTGLLFEKQHAVVGTFQKTPDDPEFTLTEETLEHMAKETNRWIDNGNLCPLPTNHTDDVEASRGLNLKWFVKDDSKGRKGLFSKVEFRNKEAALLAKTSATSLWSPPSAVDGNKNVYIRHIGHVALTTKPVLAGLDGFTPIAASFVTGKHSRKENNMPTFKSLAESLDLKLSNEATEDDISKVFVEHFKNVGASNDELTKKNSQLTLELSEYQKLNPPKADPVHVSKMVVETMQENRELKLAQLVTNGNILPCVKDSLAEIFCSTATLTLCLSTDSDDGFNKVIHALNNNDSIKLAETMGPQAGDLAVLKLSTSAEDNPLIADAEKKAKAFRAARA